MKLKTMCLVTLLISVIVTTSCSSAVEVEIISKTTAEQAPVAQTVTTIMTIYLVTVKLENGTTTKIQVNENIWSSIEVGQICSLRTNKPPALNERVKLSCP